MDEKLLFLFNRDWTSPALDRVMALASSFDAWLPIIAIVLVVLLVRGSFRLRACVITAALIIGINDGVVSKNLKKAVDRPRPHQSHNDVRIVDLEKASPRILAAFKPVKVKLSRISLDDVEGRSFPSSHTMNTWTAAIVAAAFFGRRAWWMALIAMLVSYSRIYTGSHWPSDVLTSIFLAFGTTLVMLALCARLWQTVTRRYFPRMHESHPDLFAS